MKQLITILLFTIAIKSYSQSSKNELKINKELKIENIDITINVDSAEELKSTFKVKDIKEIINSSEDNEAISFKIVCNGKSTTNGLKSYVSYKVKDNTINKKDFLKRVKKIRTSAINYYKNKAK